MRYATGNKRNYERQTEEGSHALDNGDCGAFMARKDSSYHFMVRMTAKVGKSRGGSLSSVDLRIHVECLFAREIPSNNAMRARASERLGRVYRSGIYEKRKKNTIGKYANYILTLCNPRDLLIVSEKQL